MSTERPGHDDPWPTERNLSVVKNGTIACGTHPFTNTTTPRTGHMICPGICTPARRSGKRCTPTGRGGTSAERALTARFLRHDVRRLGELGEFFDTVLDCGLLVHLIDDADRSAYLDGLRRVVPTGGRYVLLCFSGPQTDSRARQLMREEITACFADGWRVDSIESATLDSLTDEDGVAAWLVALTRT